jgi:hypothetical protein
MSTDAPTAEGVEIYFSAGPVGCEKDHTELLKMG